MSPETKAGYEKGEKDENGEKKMNPSLNVGTWKHLQEFQMEIPNSFKLRRVNLEITDSGAIHTPEDTLVTDFLRLTMELQKEEDQRWRLRKSQMENQLNKPTKTLGKKSLRAGRRTRREVYFKRPSETEFKKEKMFDKVLYCQGVESWLADLIKRWVLCSGNHVYFQGKRSLDLQRKAKRTIKDENMGGEKETEKHAKERE